MDLIKDFGGTVINLLYLSIIILMLYYRKHLGKHIGIVIAAMTVTLLTETTTVVLQRMHIIKFTTTYYVVGIIGIVYLLFLLYFYKLMQNPQLKKIQLGIVAAHIINFSVSAALNENFFNVFPDITNFTSIFLILVSLFIFLNDTFNSDKILLIKAFFPFFVAVSLTFIYVGLVPILFFSNRIVLDTEKFIFYIMLYSINIIGYSIMLAGIFFAKNQKKSII